MFSVMLNSCKGNFARSGRGNGLICTLNCIFNFLTVIKYMFHIHIIRIPGVNKQWPLACPEFMNLWILVRSQCKCSNELVPDYVHAWPDKLWLPEPRRGSGRAKDFKAIASLSFPNDICEDGDARAATWQRNYVAAPRCTLSFWRDTILWGHSRRYTQVARHCNYRMQQRSNIDEDDEKFMQRKAQDGLTNSWAMDIVVFMLFRYFK